MSNTNTMEIRFNHDSGLAACLIRVIIHIMNDIILNNITYKYK